MFGFKQFFNVFAAHTTWVVGNTLFMEKSVATQVLALWNNMTVEELHKKMKEDPSLKNFFAIDNNRHFHRYRRIIVYNFETEECILYPDDEDKRESKSVLENDMNHILLLLQEFSDSHEVLVGPISISLKRKKGEKFLQTAVVNHNKSVITGAVDTFRVQNLMGQFELAMNEEEVEALKASKFICDRVIGGIKKHYIDRTKHGMIVEQEKAAKKKLQEAKDTEKRLAKEVGVNSASKSVKKVASKVTPLQLNSIASPA